MADSALSPSAGSAPIAFLAVRLRQVGRLLKRELRIDDLVFRTRGEGQAGSDKATIAFGRAATSKPTTRLRCGVRDGEPPAYVSKAGSACGQPLQVGIVWSFASSPRPLAVPM